MTRERTKRWFPLSPGFAKINVNVDASVVRNEVKGSFTSVCRDEKGKYLGASAVVMTMSSLIEPEILEAMACNEALN